MAISDLTLLSTYAIELGICMVREDKPPILDPPTVLDFGLPSGTCGRRAG